MNEVIRTKHHGIHLKEWGLSEWIEEAFGFDSLEPKIARVCEEVLRHALKDDSCCLHWPALWGPIGDGHGGLAPEDPLTLYFHIPLNNDDGNGPIYCYSMTDDLVSAMEDCASDGSFLEQLKTISCAMHKLLERVDFVIAEGQKHSPTL